MSGTAVCLRATNYVQAVKRREGDPLNCTCDMCVRIKRMVDVSGMQPTNYFDQPGIKDVQGRPRNVAQSEWPELAMVWKS